MSMCSMLLREKRKPIVRTVRVRSTYKIKEFPPLLYNKYRTVSAFESNSNYSATNEWLSGKLALLGGKKRRKTFNTSNILVRERPDEQAWRHFPSFLLPGKPIQTEWVQPRLFSAGWGSWRRRWWRCSSSIRTWATCGRGCLVSRQSWPSRWSTTSVTARRSRRNSLSSRWAETSCWVFAEYPEKWFRSKTNNLLLQHAFLRAAVDRYLKASTILEYLIVRRIW